MLLAASFAVGQQPKSLYIQPGAYPTDQYLDEMRQKKLTKEFTKQCPNLVKVSRFPGAVYEIRPNSYDGIGEDLFRLDAPFDPDPVYRTRAIFDKNAVKDICNYLRGQQSAR